MKRKKIKHINNSKPFPADLIDIKPGFDYFWMQKKIDIEPKHRDANNKKRRGVKI